MANRTTFIEACNAYERLVTSTITIQVAIQEAVDCITVWVAGLEQLLN